jgi:two-component system response regulator
LLPTILLVDADPDAGAMVRDALLEGAGPVELKTVHNPDELDEYVHSDQDASRRPPTLIVVDLDLPDDAAIQAIARLKEDPERRRVPVVALTRTADHERIARAYDAGANTVIPRPVTFLALVRLMKVFTAYWLEAAALP